ncbi:MAG: FhaA domain-containing protein [Actinomycetota bacterium]|nr:FhaA domain-containing protein [Actinomycetota bacterium]
MSFRFVRRRESSALRPIEIGRKLLKAIDDAVDTDTEGRRIGPDKFAITLSDLDRENLANDERALIDELSAAAIAYIRDEGLDILAAIDVIFSTDASLDSGQLKITATITRPQSPENSQTPEPSLDASSAIDPIAEAPPHPAVELPPPAVTPAPEPVIIHDEPEPSPASAAIAAIVEEGGTRHPVSDTKLRMGRSTDNSVQIADNQASRLHAEVRYENGQHHIVDLGSTNGTFVNGIQIEKTYTLSHGDIIRIGATELRYESS